MDISTEIFHLQEQLFYRDEKPYTMRYRPEGPAAAEISNVMREKHDVVVLDMRKDLKQYSIDRNGFEVHLLEKHFPPEALENHEEIVEMYLPELKKKLLELFPGCRVDFISYLIRKREASFPYSTGEKYSFGQPNIVAHIDATPEDLVRQIIQRHGSDAQPILSGRAQYISFWKPLRGPLQDFPLALCDKRSVKPDTDLEAHDVVDRNEVLENVHVYHRPRHQWHYLSEQLDSEVLVFRQADTRADGFGVPHAAVFNPAAAADCFPRESIEVVAFVYTKE